MSLQLGGEEGGGEGGEGSEGGGGGLGRGTTASELEVVPATKARLRTVSNATPCAKSMYVVSLTPHRTEGLAGSATDTTASELEAFPVT